MHIYFSGIGGAGIGPLAMVAHQAGFTVSGSDKQDSQYIQYLKKNGIKNIHVGQTRQAIASIHEQQPIDWFVYTSALPLENPNADELVYCADEQIKTSKRDEFLNQLLHEKKLKLLAIAGTHGKTTTTAMTVWLLLQIGMDCSYLLPAKTSFADLGHYSGKSDYFVYEADEFDRNFLAYEPAISLITGVSWDHHEIFPTREDYQAAFREFISQSGKTILWQEDAAYLAVGEGENIVIEQSDNEHIQDIDLLGQYNRLDGWLAIYAVHTISHVPIHELVKHISRFPGLQRRMEQLIPNLYTDYAHTPEKIRGGISVASEMAQQSGKNLIVLYEPLTNRRQHYMLDDYTDCFTGATHVYWLPSYLAREDPSQRIIEPTELISHLSDPSIASPAMRDDALRAIISKRLQNGDMVVGMAGGGGDSLDDWLRATFVNKQEN